MGTSIRRLATIPAVAALVAAACGGADPAPETTVTSATAAPAPAPQTGPPSGYAAFRAQPTACGADRPPEAAALSFAAPGDAGLDPAAAVEVTISTSCGDIVVLLDPQLAPETVNSFVFLASNGFFDGTASHRIVPGFVVQAGDPTATGFGGPGYVIPDELPPPERVYERGDVAMANAGPGTGGSQFFIAFADLGLPTDFTVFGRVVTGFDVLDRIESIPLGLSRSGETSAPLETLYIESVMVTGPPG